MSGPVVVGVDSGASMGIAAMDCAIRPPGNTWIILEQLPSEDALKYLHVWLHAWSMEQRHVLVAAERFITPAGVIRSQQHDAIGCNRAIEHLCSVYGHTFVQQAPSYAKTLVSNRQLHDYGLWQQPTNGNKDANDVHDAIRHSITALASHHTEIYTKIFKPRSADDTREGATIGKEQDTSLARRIG